MQEGANVGRWMPWGLAVFMALLAAYTLMWRIRGTESQPLPPTRFEIQTPPGHDLFRGAGAQLAVTPDGRTIIYIGVSSTGRALYRRTLNDLTPVVISGSEAIVVAHPVVSPDGASLAYFGNSQVRTIPLTGGTALTIAKGPGSRGITWLDNDYVAFSEPGNPTRISKVSATGGTSIALASPVSGPESRVEYIYPSTSPDGSLLAYTMWFGSLDSAKVAVRSIASGEERVLTAGTMPRFTTTGHLLFARDNALWAVAFNSRTMAVAGDAVRVVNNLQINGGGLGLYAVSEGGTLAYVPGDRGTQRTLVWVDRNGREEPLGTPPGPYSGPRISPDGSRIVVEKIESAGGDGEVWVWDVARRQFARLTGDPNAEWSPVWTLDSQHIVFRSNRDGGMKLYRQRSDGAQSAVRLTGDNVDWEPLGFTPKGELVVQETFPNTVRRLGVLSIKTAEPFQMLLQGQPVAAAGEVSPDGSWLAYQSNESGQFEVYVRPYPNINDQRWMVSQNGGSEPAWSPDGRELFYVSADGGLMSVPAQKTSGFSSGTGTPVISARYSRIAGVSGRRQYDVSRDGTRFLVSKESGGTIVVIQNWDQELKRLVPTR